MGIYADLPVTLRVLALGAFAGLIFFLYLFLMYVIPSSGRWLKYALSLLVGGIFGNVIDKIIYGKTVDFIPFAFGNFYVVFNLADVFQWIGCVFVLWIIFRKEHLVWFPESERQNYLINPREQLRVALNFSLIALSTSLMLGIFSFAFFKTILGDYIRPQSNVFLSFFITYLALTLLFCVISFLTGIVVGHRSAGPLYAFEKYLDQLMQGRDRKLNLRETDNYKHLEKLADKLRVHFSSDDD